MNLKLAKKIRQGMRELAQISSGGRVSAIYPSDYEVLIRKQASHVSAETGETVVTPAAIQIILQKISPRFIYKRTKRLVMSI